MSRYTLIFCLLQLLYSQTLAAFGNTDLLPVEQAFTFTANAVSAEQINIHWKIQPGYYLYKDTFQVESRNENIHIKPLPLPDGITQQDEFFGETVIYRDSPDFQLNYQNPKQYDKVSLLLKYQGCADIGVCYPPQQTTVNVALPIEKASINQAADDLFSGFSKLKLNLFEDELLRAEEAFQFLAEVKDPHTLRVTWMVADKYYLYREKFALSLEDDSNIRLGSYQIPRGEPYHDEAFGQVEIFHQDVSIDVPLIRKDTLAYRITLKSKFQGCADRGVCYPPMEASVDLDIPAAQQLAPPSPRAQAPVSEQDMIVNSLRQDSFWLTLLSFLGFGLLLSFTPCVFPMIPILSGIIIGHGPTLTTRKAFLLSLAYVLASALTYTIFGILAALFGQNLQILFQQTWIIALFSGIFIILSLSMFGFYNLELPKSWQTKLHNSSELHRNHSYWGAAIMGALSSLIVGPCVAAPLAAALIYIGQTGDVLLGGSSLFMMGLGMGIPLLIMGASAGKLLPKAGHWLNSTKAIFGVIMLAVAVWMLERILPAGVIMFLWALLLIIPAMYLKALEPLSEQASNWQRFWKGLGLVMFVYGIILIIGLSGGNSNPLQPMKSFTGVAAAQHEGIVFERVKSIEALDAKIQQASTNGQWLMLDFYADWCISCKEMEAYTFTDPTVKQTLNNFILVQADVTANNEDDQALLKRFNLFGPPGIIFYGPDQQERRHSRVVGYQNAATFLNTLKNL